MIRQPQPGRPPPPSPAMGRLVGLLSQVDQLLLAAQHDAATASRLAGSRRPPLPGEETDGPSRSSRGAEEEEEEGVGGPHHDPAADTPLNERLLALYAAETLKETRRY